MPNLDDNLKGSDEEIAEANEENSALESIKARELAKTGGRASQDPIADIQDEGHTMGHPGGQLRGDQTEGHWGGSKRQSLNRGRD